MRIRRVELRGFKSFTDRTTFQFGPGICGIVGPNGCGKSNVIDALKWTLGEQSASTLRGKAMEDVIFAGSDSRAPAGMAEVLVAFDNSDGSFGGRYARFSEIQVGRRLHRGGKSEYLLNNTSARLKDIVDLFLDSGVGARAYSIIEQGRVGLIVNAAPAERRVLIDEVAGINRFKAQRVEAERRMEKTRENLIRVADLVGEMERQRSALQRQAARALRYRQLRAEWKAASLQALSGVSLRHRHRLGDLERESTRLSRAVEAALQALEQSEARAAEAGKAAGRARALHTALREQRAEAARKRDLKAREREFRQEERRSIQDRLARSAEDVQEMRGRIGSLREETARMESSLAEQLQRLVRDENNLEAAAALEADLRARAKASRSEVEAAKARSVEAMTAGARARSEAAILQAQVEDLDRQLADASSALASGDEETGLLQAAAATAKSGLVDSRAAREEAKKSREQASWAVEEARAGQKAAQTARDQAAGAHARARARLDSLTELLERYEGFGEGVRRLMARYAPADDSGVVGVVADLLQPPEGQESRFEAALGDRLAAVVLRDRGAVIRAARWLETEGLDRVVLIALEPRPAPAGSLAAQVSSKREGLAGQLLGTSLSVGDLEAAVVAQPGVRITPLGARAEGAELRAGTASDAAAGMLERRRVARDLAVECEGLAAVEAQAEASLTEAAAAVGARIAERDRLAALAHQAELAELAARRDAAEAAAAVERARSASDRMKREREAAQGRRQRLVDQLEAARSVAVSAEARGAELDGGLDTLRVAADEVGTQSEQASEAATALRVQVAALRQTAAGSQREHRRLQGQLDELERRVERADIDREAGQARLGQLGDDIERLAAEAAQLEAELVSLDSQSGVSDRDRGAAEQSHEGALQAVRAAQESVDAARKLEGRIDVGLAEVRTALSGLRERAAADFDVDLDEILDILARGDACPVEFKGEGSVVLRADEVLPADATQAFEREAERLQASVQRLGAVNLAAATEFEEIDARFQELNGQKEDLEKALADLKKAIAKIERETRDRFKEAFEAVAQRLGQLYPRLVGGGRAELTMTEPDDLLATGIDMQVEPPGKKPQNLNLLSGGEKAMAAIALVFAIFQVKPSPFCLLDEVDAPLDEANSRRFNVMLREMAAETQFVVITHNRTTMEVADRLYGVTMQKAGISSVVSVKLEDLPEE